MTGRVFKSFLGAGLLVTGIAALLYAVLAATVIVVLGADGHKVLVLRSAFPVGQAPQSAYVYASSTSVQNSFLGRVDQALFGVPAGSVVQIVTGPNSRVTTGADGTIMANGKRTPFRGQVEPQNLTRTYVAICISGACNEGAAVLVGQDNIVGSVKGYVTFGGLDDPATPASALRS